MKRPRDYNNYEKSEHFSHNCPENSSVHYKNKKINPSNSNISSTHCPCGGGLCKIKLLPKKHEPFYCCPNICELHCGYFKLCKKLKESEILHDRPPPYPICSCGAGVCMLETMKEGPKDGPNYGRKYFICRIKKGQGACNFWQWQSKTYLPTLDMLEDTLAYDDMVAKEIDMIRKEFEDGELPLDYPLEEIEIHSSNETLYGDNMTHVSPLQSPTSPLDASTRVSIRFSAQGGSVVSW